MRTESQHEILHRLRTAEGHLRAALEMAEAFPRLRRQRHQLFPDTLETLEQLSGKYSLGLLTNGASDLQQRKIAGAGISKYFDHVLISGETGLAKPERRAFELILFHLGSKSDHAIMIGDRLATDIQGAQAAGMRTVWVNRSRKDRDSPTIPDWEISNLSEVKSILIKLQS